MENKNDFYPFSTLVVPGDKSLIKFSFMEIQFSTDNVMKVDYQVSKDCIKISFEKL